MKIYPIVENVIRIELKSGEIFELYEGREGLDITILNGMLVARELNLTTQGLDLVWTGANINLTANKEV